MAGVFFLIFFSLVVLPPVFIIRKVAVTKKNLYTFLTIAFPTIVFFINRAVIAAGLVAVQPSEQTSTDELLLSLMIIFFVFGSWAVLIFVLIKQKLQDSENNEFTLWLTKLFFGSWIISLFAAIKQKFQNNEK